MLADHLCAGDCLFVGGLEACGDDLVEGGVGEDVLDGLDVSDADLGQGGLAGAREGVGGEASVHVHVDLEGEEDREELFLVANDNGVGDKGEGQLDVVLNGDGGDVLATGRDDELLDPPGDKEEPVLVDLADVSGPEVPVLGKRLGGLLIVVHVPHHDLAAAGGDLPVALGVGVLELHLGPGHGHTARPGPVVDGPRDGDEPCRLRHPVHLHNGEIERHKVLVRLERNGRSAGGTDGAPVQPERSLDLVKDERGKEPAPRPGPAALRRVVPLQALPLGPRRDGLLEPGRLLAHGLHLFRNLLPHTRDTQEQRGPHLFERLAKRALERIRPCEKHLSAQRQGAVHVQHLRSNVRQREVRQHRPALLLLKQLKGQPRSPGQVVVRHHHTLGRPGRPRRVDERRARPGVGRSRDLLNRSVLDVVPKLHKRRPVHHKLRRPLGDRVVVHNHVLQRRALVLHRQNPLQQLVVLHKDDLRLAMVDHILARVGLVGRVDPGRNRSGVDGSQIRNQPLGRVEPNDAHSGKLADVEVDHRLGSTHHITVVLGVRPRLPLVAPLNLTVQSSSVGRLLNCVCKKLLHSQRCLRPVPRLGNLNVHHMRRIRRPKVCVCVCLCRQFSNKRRDRTTTLARAPFRMSDVRNKESTCVGVLGRCSKMWRP